MRKKLFMGDGDKSKARCLELIEILQDSFSLISGLEQLSMSAAGKVDAQLIINNKLEIFNNANEIFTALTGTVVTDWEEI